MTLPRIMSRPAVSRLIGQGLVSMVSLLLALGVTGTYGAAVFGAVSLMIIFANFLLNLLRGALVEPATKVVAQLDEAARIGYFAKLARMICTGALILALPGWALLVILNRAMLNNPEAVTAWIATCFIFAYVCVELLRAFYQAFADSRRVLTFDILRSVLVLGALALSLWSLEGLAGLSHPDLILAGQALALVLSIILVALPDLPHLTQRASGPSSLRSHIWLARLSTAVAALRYLQVNAPALLAQVLMGETVLGIARTWQSLANIVTLPSNALRLNIMASGARHFDKSGMGQLVRHVQKAALRMLALAVLMAIPIIFLIYLLPDRFDIGQDGLAYLSGFILFNVLANTNASLTTAFYASGQLRILLVRVVIALILALAITPGLLAWFGGPGIPIAQAITAVAILVMTVVFLRQLVKEDAS